MALLGGGAGPLYAPRDRFGLISQAGCGIGHQSARPRLRTTRQTIGCLVSFGSGRPISQPHLPSAAMAFSHAAEHEPTRQLLGQCADGAAVSQPQIGMDSASRFYQRSTSTSGYQPLSDALVQLAAAATIQLWIGARRCRGKTLNCVRDDLSTTVDDSLRALRLRANGALPALLFASSPRHAQRSSYRSGVIAVGKCDSTHEMHLITLIVIQ